MGLTMNKYKKLIKKLALWLLEWADEAEIERISFDKNTTVRVVKYLPKENKWYHIAYTVSMFAKREGKDIIIIDDLALFRDGKVTPAKLWRAYKVL